MRNRIKNHRGFSILESMIGVFIVGMIFVVFLKILPKMITSEKMSKETIIATNLAQEGIEQIRNRRDNNLKNNNCEAFSNISPCSFPTTTVNSEPIPGFSRSIIINLNGDIARVSVKVTWSSNKSVDIRDELSAWGQKE